MLHFLDSGAHTLINQVTKASKKQIDFSFYDTKQFWDYVDDYAEFVKQHKSIVDYYANVDVIGNPKRTWKVQRYLEEEHGLHPIPVIHYGASMHWLDKYLSRGYKYIAMGGPFRRANYLPWADRAWNLICDTPHNLPACKVHGFSVADHRHIVRYPWYSVDSVTWKKMAYYGQILVPPMKDGKFTFKIPNLVVFVDPKSKYTLRKGRGKHFLHLSKASQKVIKQWLKLIGVPFGKSGKHGSIIKRGVCNCEIMRRAATIQYYLELKKTLPPWPWPFHVSPPAPTLEELCKR